MSIDTRPAAGLTVDELRALVYEVVREAMAAGAMKSHGLIDQRLSPLGKRRHGEAVRRRIAEGLPGAAKIGRQFFLTQTALDEELAAESGVKRIVHRRMHRPVAYANAAFMLNAAGVPLRARNIEGVYDSRPLLQAVDDDCVLVWSPQGRQLTPPAINVTGVTWQPDDREKGSWVLVATLRT